MERQKKPWDQMTEEERQVIRESWKHTLPEEFDVFCIGILDLTEYLKIPGNLYVSDDVETDGCDLNISETFVVNGNIDAGDVTVGNNFIVNCNAACYNVSVGGDFLVYGDVDTFDITVDGDVIVNGEIDSTEINIGNLFDCNDVDSNTCKIHAADFVCRRYEEENK